MFDEPTAILLSADQYYAIEALIQGPDSFSGEKGKLTRECNGTTFRFLNQISPNGTTVSIGQFPQIIFTKTVC